MITRINANNFNRRQANAEQNVRNAIANVEHALDWLKLDKPEGKPTGTVPWAYDLNEARDLLERAVTDIGYALGNALDPDTTVIENYPKAERREGDSAADG